MKKPICPICGKEVEKPEDAVNINHAAAMRCGMPINYALHSKCDDGSPTALSWSGRMIIHQKNN